MVCVRCTTKADKADDNQAAIEKVFEELVRHRHGGTRRERVAVGDRQPVRDEASMADWRATRSTATATRCAVAGS